MWSATPMANRSTRTTDLAEALYARHLGTSPHAAVDFAAQCQRAAATFAEVANEHRSGRTDLAARIFVERAFGAHDAASAAALACDAAAAFGDVEPATVDEPAGE